MRKIVLFLVVLTIALFTCLTTIIVVEGRRVVRRERYVMDVLVREENRIGFNVDPDGLHFGSMPAGSSGQRELRIHQVEEDVFVSITKEGEIAAWVSNPNNFIVKKGDMSNIIFQLDVPEDAALGNYTGEVIITLMRR